LNNRGLYLLALGRYEEALADFERAVAAHPFGARQAQIQLLNQVATLVTLGQVDRARAAARDLTGPFATYIQLLLATATDDWVGADSAAADRDTSGPGLITYGLWAAQLGDSVGARRRLRRVLRLSESERARLGYGSALLQARLAAGAGRWADVVASIGPAAARGEHDSA